MTGKIEDVSNGAVFDKKNGLHFIARIKLPTNQFRVERKWVHLTPGMEVQTEIRTGRRTVAEYFLSPLIDTASNSLRER